MHAYDLLANDAADRHRVEHISEGFEKLDVVAALHIVEEAVHFVNASALVVATQQEEVLGIHNLVAILQNDRFNAVLAAVDVVAKEQVVRVRGEATLLVDAQQVIVLAMRVAAHAHRRTDL